MSASKASASWYRAKAYAVLLNVQPMAGLHSETGNHQGQVKVLIEKTASSLDDTALKMFFVSVQQNNIDICVQYAINAYVMFLLFVIFENDLFQPDFLDWCPWYRLSSSSHSKWLCVRLNSISIQEALTWRTLTWFGHSYVSKCSIHWTGYSLQNRNQWVSTQICKYLSSFKIIIAKIYFRRVSAEAEEKKGYVK